MPSPAIVAATEFEGRPADVPYDCSLLADEHRLAPLVIRPHQASIRDMRSIEVLQFVVALRKTYVGTTPRDAKNSDYFRAPDHQDIAAHCLSRTERHLDLHCWRQTNRDPHRLSDRVHRATYERKSETFDFKLTVKFSRWHACNASHLARRRVGCLQTV